MNSIKNILTEWNSLDKLFYKIDLFIISIKSYKQAPDAEYMIEAETKYLKAENETLKALQYPKKIIKDGKNYYCPNSKCKEEISSVLIEKYKVKFCPECGQRIYYNSTTSYRETRVKNC